MQEIFLVLGSRFFPWLIVCFCKHLDFSRSFSLQANTNRLLATFYYSPITYTDYQHTITLLFAETRCKTIEMMQFRVSNFYLYNPVLQGTGDARTGGKDTRQGLQHFCTGDAEVQRGKSTSFSSKRSSWPEISGTTPFLPFLFSLGETCPATPVLLPTMIKIYCLISMKNCRHIFLGVF